VSRIESLVENDDARSIVEDPLALRAITVDEENHRAPKRIESELRTSDLHHHIRRTSEVDGIHGDVDGSRGGDENHEALTVRRSIASVFGSMCTGKQRQRLSANVSSQSDGASTLSGTSRTPWEGVAAAGADCSARRRCRHL
jgi:hypothetical protein